MSAELVPGNMEDCRPRLTSQDELANGGDEASEEGIVRLLLVIKSVSQSSSFATT